MEEKHQINEELELDEDMFYLKNKYIYIEYGVVHTKDKLYSLEDE